MAFRVLGQAAGTGALAALYTVQGGKQAVTSTLVLLNTSTSADAPTRVTVAPAGAADAPVHTIFDDVLGPRDRHVLQEGWTLGPGDIVRVSAPASVRVHLFGSESAA